MSPIVGSLAGLSARSLGWGLSAPGAAYELISTQVLASAAASVTFNLSAGQQAAYKHLQLRIITRSTAAGAEDNLKLQFNSDTATNYVTHNLYGTGTAANSNWPGAAQNYTQPGSTLGASAVTNGFDAHIIDILDAFSTSKNKTVRSSAGFADPSIYRVYLTSGLWLSTSALSSLVISTNASLATSSRFSLYGVRG
jgi:hypothetical protein